MTSIETEAPARAGRPPWLLFAVVSMALFMSSLDGTIVSTGLPTLRHALGTSINWAAWAMTAYQLGLVVAMPIAGRVADTFGRKQVFLVAAVLFTGSSLLCGLSSDIGMLIGLRVIQAVGGAAFMPSASGIVMDTFGEHRHRALGLFSSIFPLGALVGPIAGGIVLATWSWRGLFLVNVPIGAAFTLLAWRYLPKSERRPARPDVLGALLMGAAVLGIMMAVTDLGNRGAGVTSPGFAFPFALSLASGWAFLRHCARSEDPLIPLHLLRGRAFAATNAINLVWGRLCHRLRVTCSAVFRRPLRAFPSLGRDPPYRAGHWRDLARRLGFLAHPPNRLPVAHHRRHSAHSRRPRRDRLASPWGLALPVAGRRRDPDWPWHRALGAGRQQRFDRIGP